MGQNHYAVPQDYRDTAHPELMNSRLNRTNMRLEIKVIPGLGFSSWRWNLSSLEPYHKHLFLPIRFLDPELQRTQPPGWCTDKQNDVRSAAILAQYEPYIYTLENEILARKVKNMHFKEHELWKILKAGALALRDWHQAYKDTLICTLNPRNIVFNAAGHAKVVNRFSFIEPAQEVSTYAYSRPEESDPLALSIYALGATLLDAVSLNQSQYSGMGAGEKKKILTSSSIYPLEIKTTILGMAQEDPERRMKLDSIFCSLVKYKRLSLQEQD